MPRKYIGGKNNQQVRQKYYDTDPELSALVKEVAQQYQLNPNILASRIADEGPIDKAIRVYNQEGPYNGYLLTQSAKRQNEQSGEYEDRWGNFGRFYSEGQNWGLDDLDTRINNGDIKILGDYSEVSRYNSPYDFENEAGRITKTRGIPSLRYGIEATAAELQARRNKMMERYPNMSDQWYDAASQASFNYGEEGVKKFGINIPKKFNPYIVLKKKGGLIQKYKFMKIFK